MRTRVTTSIASEKAERIKHAKYATVALIIIVALSALMVNPLWVSKGVAAGTAPVTKGDVRGDGVHYLGCLPPDASVVSDFPKLTVPESPLTLATSVDLSEDLPPVGNQGHQGSCVGWSTGYYYKSCLESKEHNYPSWDLTNQWYQYSPSFIYNQINFGYDSGAYLSDAFILLEEKGDTDIDWMPYDQWDYTKQPTEVQFEAAKPYRNDDWGNFWSHPDFGPYSPPNDINAVKSWLNSGKMLVMGIPIYGDFPAIFGNPSNPYYVYDGTAGFAGGHAVCICGYDDNANPGGPDADHRGGFKMVNSWGPDWNGDSNGFVYLSYDFVKRYVYEAWSMSDLPSPDTPSVTSLSQDSGAWGDSIHIYGNNFGTLRRGAKVEFTGVQATQLSFTNEDITVTVPENATSGPVRVSDWEGTQSNSVPFTVGTSEPDPHVWVTDGPVYSTVTTGTTTYIGGRFTHVGDQARNNIAAIDTDPSSSTYGHATSWDPNATGTVNATVNALAVSGSTVYAGGSFTNIGGRWRNNIAAIDATTGVATTWNPDANGTVNALAVSGSTVYAGGSFTGVGGQTRNRIAAIDADPLSRTYDRATPWDPNAAGGDVNALAVRGSTVYAGGSFTSIKGKTRNHLAAINSSGAPTPWDPNANDTVNALALAVRGSTVYAGGDFTSIKGQQRKHIAAIKSSGAPTPWDPNANGTVRALAVSDSAVYAGGDFTSIGGMYKNHIAGLKTEGTGAATFWNLNANDVVCALAVRGSTVSAGGKFTSPVSYFAVIADKYPDITRISPTRSRNNVAERRIRLKGIKFLPHATVKLKMGWRNITATIVTVESPERITCYFDLRGAAPGYWNVYVENPDGRPGGLPGGFQIL